MRFSIITVTRNNLQGLQRTHASVKAQIYTDFEWIIIDGASDDGTKDYLPATGAVAISEPDGGLYDAMNKGLAHARGDYLILMNAGDSFAAPDVLQKISAAISAQTLPPAFIYGDSLEEIPNAASPLYKPARSYRRIIQGMFTHHQAMIYNRELVGPLRFDTAYKIAADYKFTATFLQETSEILYLNFPVCIFEAGGLSQQRVRLGRAEQYRARRELALCGTLENILIYAVQLTAITVRRVTPRFYWWLRQKG